jgi:hypothetical protein
VLHIQGEYNEHIILSHVDPLLGGYRERDYNTTAIARQQLSNNNRGMVLSARSAKQQLNSNRGTVFSVRSVPRCYKQDIWSNEFFVGQLPASENMNTEAEDIAGIFHQATTCEDTAD